MKFLYDKLRWLLNHEGSFFDVFPVQMSDFTSESHVGFTKYLFLTEWSFKSNMTLIVMSKYLLNRTLHNKNVTTATIIIENDVSSVKFYI